MIQKRTKPNTDTPLNSDVVNTNGNLDYIKNGVIYKNAPIKSVLVTAQSDLSGLTDKYEAGTIAYTAGFKSIWQLGADGTWTEV